jgi:hypothetical protein
MSCSSCFITVQCPFLCEAYNCQNNGFDTETLGWQECCTGDIESISVPALGNESVCTNASYGVTTTGSLSCSFSNACGC